MITVPASVVRSAKNQRKEFDRLFADAKSILFTSDFSYDIERVRISASQWGDSRGLVVTTSVTEAGVLVENGGPLHPAVLPVGADLFRTYNCMPVFDRIFLEESRTSIAVRSPFMGELRSVSAKAITWGRHRKYHVTCAFQNSELVITNHGPKP